MDERVGAGFEQCGAAAAFRGRELPAAERAGDSALAAPSRDAVADVVADVVVMGALRRRFLATAERVVAQGLGAGFKGDQS